MQKDERGGTVAYREGMTRREVFASAAVVGAIRQAGSPLRVEERVTAEPRGQTASAARS